MEEWKNGKMDNVFQKKAISTFHHSNFPVIIIMIIPENINTIKEGGLLNNIINNAN